MFDFLVAAGLPADERTRDAARTIAYLVRGATTDFASEIATTEEELMSIAATAIPTALLLLGIEWPPTH